MKVNKWHKTNLLSYTHMTAIISYYGLLLLFVVFNAQLPQVAITFKLLITSLQISPLLLFIRGLHLVHTRSIIWLCFISLTYFIHGVLKTISDIQTIFGWTETILSLVLFVTLAISAKGNINLMEK